MRFILLMGFLSVMFVLTVMYAAGIDLTVAEAPSTTAQVIPTAAR